MTRLRFMVLLLALGGAIPAASQSAAPAVLELDRIVAVVNNDVIVESELEEKLQQVRAQLRQSGTPAPDEVALQTQVLERLIVERLQLQLARESGIRVEEVSRCATRSS